MRSITRSLIGVPAIAAFLITAGCASPAESGIALASGKSAGAAEPVQSRESGGPGDPGEPGLHNAITDVAGIEVGQVQSSGDDWLTGTTVVYAPETALAGVSQRGGAPATKELDLLSPLNSNSGVNAVALNGSSAYGLDATTGMMRWLEEREEGVDVGAGVVPIVPGMSIFDLARGGDFASRIDADWGYRALEEASDGPVAQGSVGGGTGAYSGGIRGGVGTASVTLEDGTVVGAIVVVNSVGSTVDPNDCTVLGTAWGIGDEFAGLEAPEDDQCHPEDAEEEESMNTTIAVVATDAHLEKAAATKLAEMGSDGLARAINPLHTLADGDTVIGMSTGTEDQPLRISVPEDTRELNQIFNAGADALSRAVAHAIISAESAGDVLSYCETYPSAGCAELGAPEADTAVEIDPDDPLGEDS